MALKRVFFRIAECAPTPRGPNRAVAAYRALVDYETPDGPHLAATLARVHAAGIPWIDEHDLFRTMLLGADISSEEYSDLLGDALLYRPPQ